MLYNRLLPIHQLGRKPNNNVKRPKNRKLGTALLEGKEVQISHNYPRRKKAGDIQPRLTSAHKSEALRRTRNAVRIQRTPYTPEYSMFNTVESVNDDAPGGANDKKIAENCDLATTACFRCGREICFDPKIVGPGTGRCILIDVNSHSPHKCVFRKQVVRENDRE